VFDYLSSTLYVKQLYLEVSRLVSVHVFSPYRESFPAPIA
jgi:hypothetical protein